MKLLVTLLFACVLLYPKPVFAQGENSLSADLISPTPPVIEYTLPYPGLLPDNPFYRLKVLRDFIVEFLIKDPLKKAQFDLLQADKRLEAGLLLISQRPEKAKLALDTISKSENYFVKAIGNMHVAKAQGISTVDFAGKLALAARKHEELIKNIETSVTGKEKGDMEEIIKRTVNLRKQATALAPK